MVMVEDGTNPRARRRIDESLRKDLEWSGDTRARGSWGAARSCPLCGGVDPNDHGRFEFTPKEWGHADDCDLQPRPELGPSGKMQRVVFP